jgi:hypothetical protein
MGRIERSNRGSGKGREDRESGENRGWEDRESRKDGETGRTERAGRTEDGTERGGQRELAGRLDTLCKIRGLL